MDMAMGNLFAAIPFDDMKRLLGYRDYDSPFRHSQEFTGGGIYVLHMLESFTASDHIELVVLEGLDDGYLHHYPRYQRVPWHV